MATTATNPTTGQKIILSQGKWVPFDEDQFKKWYKGAAEKTGINPDPDDPQHMYDYRSAFAAGAGPGEDKHWPSQFKDPKHPNRYVDGIDTISGTPARTATNRKTGEKIYLHEGLNQWEPFKAATPEPAQPKGGLVASLKDIGKSASTEPMKDFLNTAIAAAETRHKGDFTFADPNEEQVFKRTVANEQVRLGRDLNPEELDELRKQYQSVPPDAARKQLAQWQGMLYKAKAALPDVPERERSKITQAIMGFARFAPSMVATAATGGAGGIVTLAQIYGSKYGEYRDKGVDPENADAGAFAAAILSTPVEYAGNIFQLKLLKGLAKSLGLTPKASGKAIEFLTKARESMGGKIASAGGRIAAGGATEGGEEGIQSYAEAAGDIIAENPGTSIDTMLTKFNQAVSTPEFKQQRNKAIELGAIGGTIFAGAGQGLTMLAESGKKKKPDGSPPEGPQGGGPGDDLRQEITSGNITRDEAMKLREHVTDDLKAVIDEALGTGPGAGPPPGGTPGLFPAQTKEEQTEMEAEVLRQRAAKRNAEQSAAMQKKGQAIEQTETAEERQRSQQATQQAGLAKTGEVPGQGVDIAQQNREAVRRTGKVESPVGLEVVPSTAMQMPAEGATATNPKTGKKIVLKNGSWVPANQIKVEGKNYRQTGEAVTTDGEQVGRWMVQGKDGKWIPIKNRERLRSLDAALDEEQGPEAKPVPKSQISPVSVPFQSQISPVQTDTQGAAAGDQKEQVGADQPLKTQYEKLQEETGARSLLDFNPKSDEFQKASDLAEQAGADLLKGYETIHGKSKVVVFANKEGTKGLLVHKSTKSPGKVQATRWDQRGFSGDSQYVSFEEALKEELSYSKDIRYPNPDAFRNASATDEFTNGILEVEKAQKEHWERMTGKKPTVEPKIEEPASFFKPTEASMEMDIDDIIPREPISDFAKYERGEQKMTEAIAGRGPKRKPVTVMPTPSGYRIIDGNTTYHLLKKMGAERVTVTIGNLRQKTGDMDELYRLAEKSLEQHKELTEAWAKEFGGRAVYRPKEFGDFKGRERSQTKARVDYAGANEYLTDIVASTVLFKTEGEAVKAFEKIKGRPEIFYAKNRFASTTTCGYADILMKVRLPSGMITEIQLNTEQLFQAKEKGLGHKLYEVQREIYVLIQNGETEAIRKDAKAVNDIFDRESKKYYDRARRAKSTEEVDRLASDSEIIEALNRMSNALRGSLTMEALPSKQAAILPELLSDTKIVPSLSKNSGFISPASEQTVSIKGKKVNGNQTKIVLPNEKTVDAQFAVMEMDDITASHSGITFSKKQGYPEGVQERQYHRDKEEQLKVIRRAANLKTNLLLTNNPDAINGPPIVTQDGIVLGGNSRAMLIERAYADDVDAGKGSKYKDRLIRFANQFGIDPGPIKNMQRPILVRQMEVDSKDTKQLHRLATAFNQSLTQSMSREARAASMGANVSDETIEWIGTGLSNTDKTIREFLSGPQGIEALTRLINDGVIARGDKSQYISASTNKLNGDGMDIVEQTILGSVIDDAGLLSTPHKSYLNKVAKALPYIAKVRARGEQWDITPDLKDALRAVLDTKDRDMKSIEAWAAQMDMFGDKVELAKTGRGLAGFLWDEGPVAFSRRWKGYSADAAADIKNQIPMFGVKSQKESLAEHFEVGEQVALFNNDESLLDAGPAVVSRKQRRTNKAAKPEAPPVQFNLFGYNQYDDLFKKEKPKPKFKPADKVYPDALRVDMETTGYIKSAGHTVRNTDAAAALLSGLSKSAQEQAFFVAVDKDGTILEIHRYSKGDAVRSIIQNVEAIGHLLDQKEVSRVYFAHNHPGVALVEGADAIQPSADDIIVSEMLGATLELSDIEIVPMIIGGGRYRQFSTTGEPFAAAQIHEESKTEKLEVKERTQTRTGEPGKKIAVAGDAMAAFKKYNDQEGILFLNSQNVPIAFMKWPAKKNYRDATVDIYARAARTGARNLIFNLKGSRTEQSGTSRNVFIRRFVQASAGDLRLLDIISNGRSMLEMRSLPPASDSWSEKTKNLRLLKTLQTEVGSSDLAADILNHAIALKEQGIDSYRQFRAQMKQRFADVWDKIKHLMRSLWDVLNNQRGAIGPNLPSAPQQRMDALIARYAGKKIDISPRQKLDIENTTKSKVAFELQHADMTKEGIKNYAAKAYASFFMQEYPIVRFAMRVGKTTADEIEKQVRRIRGAGGITESILTAGSKTPFINLAKDGVAEYSHLGDTSLQKILQPLNTKDLYQDYERMREAERDLAFAKYRKEDIDAGKLKGIDPDNAKKVLALLKKKYGPDFEALQAVSRQHTRFEQDAVLKTLLKSGWMSQEQYDAIMDRPESEFYASYLREMEEVEKQTVGSGGDPVKRIYGSEKRKIPSTEGTIANVLRTVRLVEKQRLNKQIVALKDAAPEMEEDIVEKKPRFKAVTITFPRRDAKNKFIRDANGEKVYQTKKVAVPVGPPANTITVAEEGKKKYYELPADVLKAVDNYGHGEINALFKLLSYPTRLLRAGATLSAEFIARNPVRDQFTAFVYSKYGYNPFIDFAKGLFHTIGKTELYDEFKAAGSENSFFVSLDRQAVSLKARDMTGRGNLIKYVKNPVEALRMMSELSEKGTRVGLYGKARKKGATVQQASTEAREGTLDFGRVGTEKALNQIIAFWNASLQGTDKLFREMKNPKAVAKAVLGITLPSVILWGINHDDDRYKELPAWRKNFFWNILVPDGPILSIPKPFELGLIFGSLPERILDWLFLNDPEGMKDIAGAAAEGALPSLIPTAALPVIEHITNYSFFRGQHLEPKSLEDLPDWMRYTSGTTNLAKKAGKAVDVSPIKLENWIRNWTGTLGSGALGGFDKLFMGDDIPDVGKNWYEVAPGIKGFIGREPIGSGSKSVEIFYENAKAALGAEAGYKFLAKRQNTDAATYAKKERSNIALAKGARDELLKMSEIRRNINRIIDDKTMSPDQKRAQIDKLSEIITQRAKQFNKVYEKMTKEK